MSLGYSPDQPERAAIDVLSGATVLQFGTDWCGYCRASERSIEPVMGERPDVRRVLVEDGKGRPLGRSFRVRLWPTLIFLADGVEVARLVRPMRKTDVEEALRTLDNHLKTR